MDGIVRKNVKKRNKTLNDELNRKQSTGTDISKDQKLNLRMPADPSDGLMLVNHRRSNSTYNLSKLQPQHTVSHKASETKASLKALSKFTNELIANRSNSISMMRFPKAVQTSNSKIFQAKAIILHNNNKRNKNEPDDGNGSQLNHLQAKNQSASQSFLDQKQQFGNLSNASASRLKSQKASNPSQNQLASAFKRRGRKMNSSVGVLPYPHQIPLSKHLGFSNPANASASNRKQNILKPTNSYYSEDRDPDTSANLKAMNSNGKVKDKRRIVEPEDEDSSLASIEERQKRIDKEMARILERINGIVKENKKIKEQYILVSRSNDLMQDKLQRLSHQATTPTVTTLPTYHKQK